MFAPDLTAPFEKKKDESFGKSFAQGLESWHLMQIESPNFPRRKWAENYQYAVGNQSYLRTVQPIDNLGANDSQTLLGADLRNMKLTSTILESIVGKLNRQKFKPSVSMIDAFSMQERKDIEAKMKVAMVLKQQGADMNQFLTPLGLTPDEVPIDTTELEIMLQCMPQFTEEMFLELALQKVGKESNIEVLARMADYDDAITGTMGYYINRVNGKRQIEWLDPLNSGHSMSFYPDGRDIVWSYRIRPVPLEQVRIEAQEFLTDNQLNNLRGGQFSILYNWLYFWTNNNNNYLTTFTNTYTDYVLIMDFEYVSTDLLYTNIKNGRAYNGYTKKTPGKDGDVYTAKVQNLFGGKYICGSGYVYDYGVKPGVRQPIVTNNEDAFKVNAAKVYGSFVWHQSSMVRGETISIIDRAKPHIDAIEDTFKKFKTYVKEFLPWMIRVDQDALADLALKEGDTVTAEDLMTTLLERGLGVVSSSAYRGFHNASVKDAIAMIGNDGGANLNVLWGLLLQQINLLHDVVGVPKIDTGGGVSPEQGKAVSQMLLQGSDNVLSGLMDAKIRLYCTLWENLMYDILQTGEAGVMNSRQFMIPSGNPDGKIPNLVVEPLPTDMEWQDLYAKAQEAMAAGILTMDQYAYLKIIDNMKQAWGYLAVQQKRTEMKKAMMQQQIDQANTDRQMASNRQAQEGKEKLELLKIMGTVVGEYAKAAFTNPTNIQNPDVILQKINQQIEQIYGGGNQQPTSGNPAIPAGAESGIGAEQFVPPGGQPVQGNESEFAGGGELPPELGGEPIPTGAEYA
jgi:hypothetical protein